ncbi:O-antigen ligase family protein [Pseudomonas sp. LFM046]|uniref:O-antigen ligase family protein n=1 Tax=Pseudomonas sp. LFM046 TaxID=1608357 RepID=UPI001F5BD498|nr:O-antigen ligase family protein [Pseudomonas sp. LFM046]
MRFDLAEKAVKLSTATAASSKMRGFQHMARFHVNLMVLPGSTSARIYDFISRRWLPLGFLVLLTGLFWVAERSQYSKAFYALLALPALTAAILRPALLRQLLRDPVVLSFLAFSAWLLLSLIWTASSDSPGSLAKRPLYVFMLFLACTVMAVDEERLLLGALRIAAMIAAIAALVCLAQFFLHPPVGKRLIGTGGLLNPLLTSHLLGFFCAYWLAAWVTHQEQVHWVPLLAFIPLIAATVATGSRTPLLALLASASWLILLTNGRRTMMVMVLLGVTGLGLAMLLPESLLQRGLSLRPQIWQSALEQVSGFLWLGHGYGSDFQFQIDGVRNIWSDPHNVEIAVLLELGLIGLACWLLMYGMAFANCLRLKELPSIKIASCLMVYGLAAGMTEGSSFLSRPNESWFLIWIPLAIVVSLSIQQRLREKT